MLIGAAAAPGTTPQRRQPLGGLLEELREWEKIFDLSLDAFEATAVTQLTQVRVRVRVRARVRVRVRVRVKVKVGV